jgi:phage shock protein C
MSYKRLYRSVHNRKIGGVAGGLADYFAIDPTLVRLLWIIAFFVFGTGFLAYIIAWIIIPEAPFSSGS